MKLGRVVATRKAMIQPIFQRVKDLGKGRGPVEKIRNLRETYIKIAFGYRGCRMTLLRGKWVLGFDKDQEEEWILQIRVYEGTHGRKVNTSQHLIKGKRVGASQYLVEKT